MYEPQGYHGGGLSQYHDEENFDNSYGYNYRNYNRPAETGIKGKVEQKYWKTKQKMIERLGKDQDQFVIAGDAEVDARLEAFRHIQATCHMLMAAIELYQNRIFNLSQDENEMGRFLRDRGATDKTKAGKMMIAVGKAQSFSAQQRLGLRQPLVRLFQEVETFRFRAVQDTAITVQKMETARSEYRSKMLWMADISKELDPDLNKKLDKFRDVQAKVKDAKKLFDKLKLDVIQKIDLLSASRCNLLSATLEPYQSAMITFLESTSKSYNGVFEQFKGHPSYQFHILKHILPNNGIIDDEEEEEAEDASKQADKAEKKPRRQKKLKEKSDSIDDSVKKEESGSDDAPNTAADADAKLISFDDSIGAEESTDLTSSSDPPQQQPQMDLLGLGQDGSPGFGEHVSQQEQSSGFDDLLGKFEENNVLADPRTTQKVASAGKSDSKPASSIDDLLFGSPQHDSANTEPENEMDILSGILSNQSLGITDAEQQSSFSRQWQNMFGEEMPAQDQQMSMPSMPQTAEGVDVGMQNQQLYMPSFLMEQMRQADPAAVQQGGVPPGISSVKDSAKVSKTPPTSRKSGQQQQAAPTKNKDMSQWFSLFADLDPLSNPDDIGGDKEHQGEKQAC